MCSQLIQRKVESRRGLVARADSVCVLCSSCAHEALPPRLAPSAHLNSQALQGPFCSRLWPPLAGCSPAAPTASLGPGWPHRPGHAGHPRLSHSGGSPHLEHLVLKLDLPVLLLLRMQVDVVQVPGQTGESSSEPHRLVLRVTPRKAAVTPCTPHRAQPPGAPDTGPPPRSCLPLRAPRSHRGGGGAGRARADGSPEPACGLLSNKLLAPPPTCSHQRSWRRVRPCLLHILLMIPKGSQGWEPPIQ